MGSTWAETAAAEILAHCLRGETVPDKLIQQLTDEAADADREIALAASTALFRGIAEPLADPFEPALCNAYVAIFSRVIARIFDDLSACELVERYERVRHGGRALVRAEKVFVLSRITLGADIAVTSVILDGVKKRFPDAAVYFVGPAKNWELFAADSRLRHLAVQYGRSGTIRERLAAASVLADTLTSSDGIVVDPDSRLTQLGLLPVCSDDRYYFFESRAYGRAGGEPIGQLVKRWMAEVFGVTDARPYIAPPQSEPAQRPVITVSFGVGENLLKRVPDPFEAQLLQCLADTGLPVLVDKGAGPAEAERVDRAIAALGDSARDVQTWEGPFAPFASAIAGSKLYVGYDSAGQHVAATCGTPLVCVFRGFASERTFSRWKPVGEGPMRIIRVDGTEGGRIFERATAAIRDMLHA